MRSGVAFVERSEPKRIASPGYSSSSAPKPWTAAVIAGARRRRADVVRPLGLVGTGARPTSPEPASSGLDGGDHGPTSGFPTTRTLLRRE